VRWQTSYGSKGTTFLDRTRVQWHRTGSYLLKFGLSLSRHFRP
jgi:hypothetical protein